MKEILLNNAALAALGLDSQASAEQVNAQVVALKTQADNAAAALENEVKLKATALVDEAIANGQLQAAGKDSMIAFALQNLEAAKALIDATPKKQSLAAQVNNAGAAATDAKDNWDFKKWQKEDPKGLEAMRLNDNQKYEKLRADFVAKIA